MKNYTVNVWTGMNDAVHPGLLPEKTAAYLCDADISDGKLSAFTRPGKTLFKAPEDAGHYGDINRSVVKWYNRYYWTDNSASVKPFYGGNVEGLGIPYPAVQPNLTPYGDGPLTGTYKYCMCYVNENGWEGAPGSLEEYETSVIAAGNRVRVTVGKFPAGIKYAKLYRTVAQGAEFFYIGDIEQDGSFDDATDDETLTVLEPMESQDNYPPPDGGKYITESNGVFFVAVGEKLFFSRQGNPHAWPPLNFISFDDTITGMVREFTGILVFTTNNVYRVTGSMQEDIVKALIPGNQGCRNWRTISMLSNSPIWLSPDGLVTWNGESLNIISQQQVKTDALQVVSSTCLDNAYYLFLRGSCLIYDLKHGGFFRKSTETCQYCWTDNVKDRMYLQRNDGIYEWNAGSTGQFQWKSGLVGGTELQVHRYLELYFNAESGTVNVRFHAGGKLRMEKLFGPGRRRVKLPFGTSAKNAQIEMSGTGKLTEVALYYE